MTYGALKWLLLGLPWLIGTAWQAADDPTVAVVRLTSAVDEQVAEVEEVDEQVRLAHVALAHVAKTVREAQAHEDLLGAVQLQAAQVLEQGDAQLAHAQFAQAAQLAQDVLAGQNVQQLATQLFAQVDESRSLKRIGVSTSSPSEALVSHLRLDADEALLIVDVVAGMPAEDAGLAVHDIIVGIDGSDGVDQPRLRAAVQETAADGTLHLSLIRAGERIVLEVGVSEVDLNLESVELARSAALAGAAARYTDVQSEYRLAQEQLQRAKDDIARVKAESQMVDARDELDRHESMLQRVREQLAHNRQTSPNEAWLEALHLRELAEVARGQADAARDEAEVAREDGGWLAGLIGDARGQAERVQLQAELRRRELNAHVESLRDREVELELRQRMEAVERETARVNERHRDRDQLAAELNRVRDDLLATEGARREMLEAAAVDALLHRSSRDDQRHVEVRADGVVRERLEVIEHKLDQILELLSKGRSAR